MRWRKRWATATWTTSPPSSSGTRASLLRNIAGSRGGAEVTRKPSWKFPLLSRVPILSRLQIKHQIYLVFCLTIVFPVLLLGLFTMRQITNVLYDRAYQQLESDNLRAKSILF